MSGAWENSLNESLDLEDAWARIFRAYLHPSEIPDLAPLIPLGADALMAALYTAETQNALLTAYSAQAEAVFLLAAAAQFDALDVSGAFDLDNPYARAWIQMHGAALVTEITNSTRNGLNAALNGAISRGLTVDQTARALRSQIGFHTRAAQAYTAYLNTRLADATTARQREAAFTAADRYARRLIAERCKLIARTEIITAHAHGSLASWREADAQGQLRPGARKEWIASLGERTCDICRPLNGQKLALGESFAGGYLAPTAHPSCRCTLALTWK